MKILGFVVVYLVFTCFGATCNGVKFSSLKKTLIVTASSPLGHVLTVGDDALTIKWELDQTFPPGTDSAYKTVKLKLCYAPESQVDRPWRKTVDNLKKDKTCQHTISATSYMRSNNSVIWTLERDIPEAKFFVRAYVYNGQGNEVGYGQNTDDSKTIDLFTIRAITGRRASIDFASVCFSVFAVFSLFGFFFVERRKASSSRHK